MDLQNHTPFPALLTRFCAADDVMGSSMVARVTYDIVGSRAVVCERQEWAVSPNPWTTDYGPMEADDAFHKGGTDIFLFGSARAPSGKAVSSIPVTIEVGEFRRTVMVFGDRVWQLARSGAPLVAGQPKPFVEIPLTMANAFGGTTEWDGLTVAWPDNPNGKGYYAEVEQAVGKPLPNIEQPDLLITKWDDRPTTVGLGACPMANTSRLRAGIEFNDRGGLTRINPRLFNAAFSEMVATNVRPGDMVRVTGVSVDGPFVFAVPAVPMMLKLSFDQNIVWGRPLIDQVGIEVNKKRVFVTYRYPFRYVLYVRQARKAELVLAEGA